MPDGEGVTTAPGATGPARGTPRDLTSYAAFWPYYLREHGRPATRLWHFAGTSLALAAILLAIATSNPWWLLAALPAGYGFAWASHFFVERNRPATFTYPVWSLLSDIRMYLLWLSGRLNGQLSRAAADLPSQPDRSTAAK